MVGRCAGAEDLLLYSLRCTGAGCLLISGRRGEDCRLLISGLLAGVLLISGLRAGAVSLPGATRRVRSGVSIVLCREPSGLITAGRSLRSLLKSPDGVLLSLLLSLLIPGRSTLSLFLNLPELSVLFTRAPGC